MLVGNKDCNSMSDIEEQLVKQEYNNPHPKALRAYNQSS